MKLRTDRRATAIKKHSILVNGLKTSISLEQEFWTALQEIAQLQKISVGTLITQIDRTRTTVNLSSAIRVYVYRDLRHKGVLASAQVAETATSTAL